MTLDRAVWSSGLLTALAVAGGFPDAAALGPQDPAPVVLGDPIRDEEGGFEVRVPKGAKPAKSLHPSIRKVFSYSHEGGYEGSFMMAAQPVPPGFRVGEYVDETKALFAASGFTPVDERKTYDSKTGSAAMLRLDAPAGGAPEGFVQVEATLDLYFYSQPGRVLFAGFAYPKAQAAEWRRVMREILYSVRIISVPDDRLKAPDPAERVEDDALLLLHPKTTAPAAVKAVREDLAAALAFVRDLTGGPAAPKLKVHLFPDAARVKAAWDGAGADLPAALYVPQGRLLLAHAAPLVPPARTLGSRCEGVLVAYLDGVLGTPYGVPPWLEEGLRQGARASKRAGSKITADPKSSPLAKWIREAGRKAAFPPIRALLEAPAADFTSEKPESQPLAMALVLASRASKDEKRRAIIPRFLEEFRRHRDPDLALATALEGVDLDALEAEARALLAKV